MHEVLILLGAGCSLSANQRAQILMAVLDVSAHHLKNQSCTIKPYYVPIKLSVFSMKFIWSEDVG